MDQTIENAFSNLCKFLLTRDADLPDINGRTFAKFKKVPYQQDYKTLCDFMKRDSIPVNQLVSLVFKFFREVPPDHIHESSLDLLNTIVSEKVGICGSQFSNKQMESMKKLRGSQVDELLDTIEKDADLDTLYNQLRIYENHQRNNTFPSRLAADQFPEPPWLFDDDIDERIVIEYLERHYNRLRELQQDLMNLDIGYLKK